MPEIDSILPVLEAATYPYHYLYDNLPLRNILARIDLVNAQVDIDANILRNAIGSAGTLANRINESLEDDGSLRVDAVDGVLHNIANHEDGEKDGIMYVRMTEAERDKLSLIEAEANALNLEVQGISTIETFSSGTVRLRASDTITFSVEYPDIIRANTVFPFEAAHEHHYDIEPYGGPIPNYKDYVTTTIATPFVDGSLRVYINGIRIGEQSINVYSEDPMEEWLPIYISATDPASGTFSLSRVISDLDVIRIDFDTDFS